MERIAAGIWKVRMGEPESATPVNLRNGDLKIEAINSLPYSDTPPFAENTIRFRVTKSRCMVELPLGSSEKIYGFGLQLKAVNHTGRKKHLRTNADPIADTGDSHAPVPFYVSTKGYGVYVDTARYVSFYCGSSRRLGDNCNESLAEKKADIVNSTEELYRTSSELDNGFMLIEIPCVQGTDIYFFDGPDMKSAVQRYNLFSGGGCLPPMWGLGVLYRAFYRADMNKTIDLAEGFRNSGMPCDMIGLEPGWQSHTYSCSYTWDKERYPEPDAMIAKLRDMNYHINLWEHVFVHPSSPLYGPLKPYSGDYEVWKGLVPDLSIQNAKDIFAGYHKDQLVLKGIDGFKLDECDSSDYTGGWSFPNCSEYPSGLDGEQMHSLIGMLYQKAVMCAFETIGRRTYGQVRASHALASSLPFVLYSDLYDHKDYIRGLINAGFSGLLWTPEVRQCSSAEDLIRRLQTVVFSPQACINAWMIPNPPWLQYDYDKNLKGELLDDWEKVQDLCRNILRIRMSFIPYLYSSFAKYRMEGLPPFRALVMDYPGDENTYDIDDQYLIGDSIMVAPLFPDSDSRNVYFPIGNWYCYWTNTRYAGGRNYEIQAELDRIPLFVKEGSILPIAAPIQCVSADTCFDITVNCYGEGCKDFTLFEDDGVTFDFESGLYNLVKLVNSSDGRHQVQRTGQYQSIRYNISEWKDIG